MSPAKKTVVVLASAAAVLLAIGAALAVPARMCRHGGRFGGYGFGGGFTRVLASLDLTEDQKTEVKAILKDEESRIDPLVDELLRSKKALFEAVHSRTLDEKAVRAAASDSAGATTDLAVERARIVSRVRGILTDQQQDRLEAMRKRFQERLERRIGLARDIWKEHAADFVDAL